MSLVPDTSSNAGPQRRTLKQVPSPQPKKKILKRSISYEEAMEAKELTELRKDLTLFKKPLTTLYLFGGVVFDTVFVQPLHWAADPANLVYVATAAVLTLSYLIAHYVQGSHSAALGEVEHMFAYSMWWFGLGVASSIGLGTGAHTGTLFLFPHICAVVRTAEAVHNLDFEHTHDMWRPTPHLADSFEKAVQTPDQPVPPFFDMYWAVLFPIIIWGTGTALGELPPYLVSYSAAKAGKEDEEYQQLIGEIAEESGDSWDLIKRMERWMVDFLRHHGFWGVLLMASYPNALFDMCGLCCGHFMMPMGSFLLATTIGKGLIKAPLQGLLFVWIFKASGRHEFLMFFQTILEHFKWYYGLPSAVALLAASWALGKQTKMKLAPLFLGILGVLCVGLTLAGELQEFFGIVAKVENGLDKVLSFCDKSSLHKEEASGISAYLNPKAFFGYFVTTIILYFVVDVITKLAQQSQADEDKAYLVKKYRESD